ncbi:MAG: DnaT-like ssDNA-binding domain-containing protein [Pseudomonadota bacterium]
MRTSLHLNDLELNALSNSLSNEAKVLYILHLCQEYTSASQKITIKNQHISALLNSKNALITRGRQITALLLELHDVGLITTDTPINHNRTMNNQSVSLPMRSNMPSTEHFAISVNWQPTNTDIEQLSALVGLIDATYTEEELGEFLAYWITRNEIQLTSFQWTQKLVTFLKKRRFHQPKHHEDTKHGHQYATPEAGLHGDDNVKNLVKKYNK